MLCSEGWQGRVHLDKALHPVLALTEQFHGCPRRPSGPPSPLQFS